MAEICCEVASENESMPPCETSSRAARRKRMELRRVKFDTDNGVKQARLSISPSSFSDSGEKRASLELKSNLEDDVSQQAALVATIMRPFGGFVSADAAEQLPKFGFASVCGRRRDMEDSVAIHPSFLARDDNQTSSMHYFGVYDGHGCSHVATRCKDRLHLLVKEELNKKVESMAWKHTMEQSFSRMDKEAIDSKQDAIGGDCRCELQAPESDAVGSTAVVAIMTPDKIVVANCGDSRAVLCRNGKAVPLSNDHKPDRPDELNRIEAAGGRVIYWEGARVLGVLAMSRAIGDNYLKPYVCCEPEVTITERTGEDECLIIASDGLWDVVSNETACGVARMCLKKKIPAAGIRNPPENSSPGIENDDKACSDASLLLTKLALARRSMDNVSVVVVDLRKNT